MKDGRKKVRKLIIRRARLWKTCGKEARETTGEGAPRRKLRKKNTIYERGREEEWGEDVRGKKGSGK